jgi:Rieske Fe-S protein
MKNPGAGPECPCPAINVGRRSLLKGTVGALVELSLLRVTALAQDDPQSMRPKAGDVLVRATEGAAVPLTASDIVAGPPVLAWAMDPVENIVRNGSRFNQVLLVRLDPATLGADTQARAANGIVAYTPICTHSGCDVSDWIADTQLLHCNCHSSSFDPKDGARVTEGPAPRSLPALPLTVSDGTLVVAGGFTDRVGFDVA